MWKVKKIIMLNDEENKTPSDCWPKDINPTASYNPNIKSTVSIHTKIDSFKNKIVISM